MLSDFLSVNTLSILYNKMSLFPTETDIQSTFLLLYQFSLFCEHPRSGALTERNLELHRSLTLKEVTERAYKVSDVTELITCPPTQA